ncbi:hypothetical protein [Cribrihabitans neustonicus]|uniref:hypothetical protein n=1 Tax=Cribrihabitans neustonicus TaxID=1429085 RepID=UPI003B5BAB4D
MGKAKKEKTCFVISPIGEEHSEVRRHADCFLEYIAKPALQGTDYGEPVRVDKLDKSAHITTTIIQHLMDADLVIADLSGVNPNVFYELGIRHAAQKPCIMLSNWNPAPPFDVSGVNIIRFVHDDPGTHKTAIERIQNQIQQMEEEKGVSNPVTVAGAYAAVEKSGTEQEKLVVHLMKRVEELKSDVIDLKIEREKENALANGRYFTYVDEPVQFGTQRNALADWSTKSPGSGTIFNISSEDAVRISTGVDPAKKSPKGD